MNSAAVIGRQLRQHNTGRGPPPKGGRQRAHSHQPLTPNQLKELQKKKEEEERKKIGTIQSIRNKITVQCIWLTCKALSGGMILLIIGTTMSVVGFYADSLSTELRESGNKTIEVTNTSRHFHLHNLTYVGPVIMGLGGFFIVAAFVLTFEGHDSGSKVVPIIDDHTTTDNSLLTSLLIEDKSKEKQKSCGPFLCVPQAVDIPSSLKKSSVTFSNAEMVNNKKEVSNNGMKCEVPKVAKTKDDVKKGSNKPPPTLSLRSREYTTVCDGKLRNRELMMMQFCLDEFVPSPQDIELLDPDGCDTPRVDSFMDMEMYVSNCPITVRVQVEPRYLASMESDGLSDSEGSEPGDISKQQMPLLGKRFPLKRQLALDNA